jgi:large subunit ribosomal protein L4
MKLKYFTKDGTSSEERDYAIPTFEGQKGLQALKQVILAYQANMRQGTVSTKTRATVHGTGKKPFRQKGSGIARQGSKVGPQHYHGAVAHGPQPRDWSQRINRKMRKLALSRALFNRAGEGAVVVIEEWQLAEMKTRLFNKVVSNISPSGKLLVVDQSWSRENAYAARNIARVTLGEAGDVNALDFARYDHIIISESGLQQVLSRITGDN